MNYHPLISVVIPSYNQSKYLGNAIESVLCQNSGRVEVIVIDGGSSDGSVEIIQTFENRLAYWVSEADGGQAAAINKGFSHATGDILCWLNSDDFYLPGTLEKVSSILDSTAPCLLLGNCIHINQEGIQIHGSNVAKGRRELRLSLYDHIIQPSTFWTRAVWEQIGVLDESLCYTLDWDWFQRVSEAGVKILPIDDYLSVYRIHEDHKTGSGGEERNEEIDNFLKKWNSTELYNAVKHYRTKRRQIQFFSALLVKFRMKAYRATILQFVYPNIFNYLSLSEAENSVHTFR